MHKNYYFRINMMNLTTFKRQGLKRFPYLILLLAVSVFSLTGCGGGRSAEVVAIPDTDIPQDIVIIPEVESKIVRFIAVGDTGTGEEGQYLVANAMEDICASRGCDFAIGLGDNIYESGVDSVDDAQFSNKFEKPYKDLDFPFYMTLGNHDNSYFGGEGTSNRKGEFQVDYHYKEDRESDKWNMPARYYHFSAPLSDSEPLIDFFSLDSNPITSIPDPDTNYVQTSYKEKQAAWFQETIQSSLGQWKIAFAHHPYISNGLHGNAGMYDNIPLHGKFYQDFIEEEVCDRVDVIITGHDHDLQWLRPVESCGKAFYMVSGAGAKTRSFEDIDRNPSFFQADETLGFFYIEIEGDEFRGTAYVLNTDGEYSIAHQQTITRTAD
jgi:tartrate-resistant acid phosphatase type 5